MTTSPLGHSPTELEEILALVAHFHAVAEQNYRICCLLDVVVHNGIPEVRS